MIDVEPPLLHYKHGRKEKKEKKQCFGVLELGKTAEKGHPPTAFLFLVVQSPLFLTDREEAATAILNDAF